MFNVLGHLFCKLIIIIIILIQKRFPRFYFHLQRKSLGLQIKLQLMH